MGRVEEEGIRFKDKLLEMEEEVCGAREIREECKVVITGLKERRISVEVFADASFGNVEECR